MKPVLFWIGVIPITAFGFSSSLGTLLAFLILNRRARRERLDPEVIVDWFLIILITGFLGARIMFVVTYPESVAGDPWAFLKVWSGGLTFYGGMLSAVACLVLDSWRRGIPPLDALDMVMPFCVLGHLFGRLGCFGNGCCFGIPTDGTWGWVFNEWADPLQVPRHATQLYEAFGLCLIILVLNRMWIAGYRGGRVTAVYIALYAPLRFALEFYRGDTLSESYLFGTTLAQSTAIGMLLLAAILWSFRLPLPRPPLGTYVPDPDLEEPSEAP